MCGWHRRYGRVYAVGVRAVPVGHAWYVRDLDDVAGSTENAIRQRASRSCGGGILHQAGLVSALLAGNLIVGPFFLQFLILLRSPSSYPEPVHAEYYDHHKCHTSNNATSNRSHVRTIRCGCRAGVLDACHVRASVAVVWDERADLALRTYWAGGCGGWTFEAAFEDLSQGALGLCCDVSVFRGHCCHAGQCTVRRSASFGHDRGRGQTLSNL